MLGREWRLINPYIKHGGYTKAAIEEAKLINELIKALIRLLRSRSKRISSDLTYRLPIIKRRDLHLLFNKNCINIDLDQLTGSSAAHLHKK